MPNTSKKSADTSVPVSRAGSPWPVSAALRPRVADSASNEVLSRFQSRKLSVVMPLRVVGRRRLHDADDALWFGVGQRLQQDARRPG